MKSDIGCVEEKIKELKLAIETKQIELKNAICSHQELLKLNRDAERINLDKQLQQAEERIIHIGLAQKSLFEKLRAEYGTQTKTAEVGATKNGVREKKCKFSKASSSQSSSSVARKRPRKRNLLPRMVSDTSVSDDSVECQFVCPSPEPANPLMPQDMSQLKFLGYFRLTTHETHREMQFRRVQRKRKTIGDPQFLYGSGDQDIHNTKCKKRAKAKKKKAEKASPPAKNDGEANGTDALAGQASQGSFPGIPKLPSELTIELVSPSKLSPGSESGVSSKYSEKSEESRDDKNDVTVELNQLKDRYSQLTVSLQSQNVQEGEISTSQQSDGDKLEPNLNFVDSTKSLSAEVV